MLLAIVDTEGIVTKETKYGDSSRILTVISRELGKISILAGSVRRGKSGLLTATAMFSHSRFTLFKGGSSSLYKLNEGELLHSFAPLRESLEEMAFASYFCDVTNCIIQEEAPDPPQTDLLLRTLYMLTRPDEDFEKIKAVFEFRSLTIAGLFPNLRQCGGCGRVDGLHYLSPTEGCIYCAECAAYHADTIQITDSMLAAISYIALAEDKKEFSFTMQPTATKYLSEIGERCVEQLLEKSFKTLSYLRRVTSLG